MFWMNTVDSMTDGQIPLAVQDFVFPTKSSQVTFMGKHLGPA